MFATILLMMLAVVAAARPERPTTEPATRPAQHSERRVLPAPTDLEDPGPLGFALYYIELANGPADPDPIVVEGRLKAHLYGVDHKVFAVVGRGDMLPKPFQDWRVVGIPLYSRHRTSIIITNIATKQTVELEQAKRAEH